MVINWVPAAEPDLCVTADELQQQCRVDDTRELPSLLLHAAGIQDRIERLSGHLLSVRQLTASFPYSGRIRWGVFPVSFVTSIEWTPEGGDPVMGDPATFRIGEDGLVWLSGAVTPEIGDVVTMEIQAGHEVAPAALRLCLLAGVSHSYDNRDAMSSEVLDKFLARAVAPYRRHWLA
jgi:hypothetical protein